MDRPCKFCGEKAKLARQPDVFQCSVCGEIFFAEKAKGASTKTPSGAKPDEEYQFSYFGLFVVIVVTGMPLWIGIIGWILGG